MFTNGKWIALIMGTLAVLAGCGSSDDGGQMGATGSCHLTGGMTVEVPVRAVAGPISASENTFSLLTVPMDANQAVTGNVQLGSTAFSTATTYTLALGKDGTFVSSWVGPVGSRTQWIAGSLSGTNPTKGQISLKLTSFGAQSINVAHGTLTATLKPYLPATGQDVIVSCTF